MKKLLCSAAVCGLALAATPANAADGVKLELGGFAKLYGFYTDQDDDSAASESRDLDIVRETEVHFGGETTLDNGLTVGVHIETEADGDYEDSFDVQESYAYFSGGWGRVNFGAEDGAAYLLQVEAPSADDNLDGIRQDVNPINFTNMQTGAGSDALTGLFVQNGGGEGLDYDQDGTGYADKLSYLSPIWNGFQFGVSYTPDVADIADQDALNEDDVENAFGAAYEAGVRYEGQFNNVGLIVGAGYTHIDLEQEEVGGPNSGEPTDDRAQWNAGIDLDIGPFGIGAAYTVDDFGGTDTVAGVPEDVVDDEKTIVVGVDYTTGPFKLGASYLNKEAAGNVFGDVGDVTDGVDVDRYAGGVTYTYGPGMTFRGSISHAEFDNVGSLTSGDSTEATSVLLGTQIDF